jgi:glycerol-3-phosphate acyltransferase PlsY
VDYLGSLMELAFILLFVLAGVFLVVTMISAGSGTATTMTVFMALCLSCVLAGGACCIIYEQQKNDAFKHSCTKAGGIDINYKDHVCIKGERINP